MLALETLRSCKDEFKKAGDDDIQMENFSMGEDDFTTGNLLDDINFDDLFAGIDYGDVLPDLEIDPDLLAEFSLSTASGGEEYSELNGSIEEIKREDDRGSGSSGLSSTSTTSSRGEEIVSKRDESGGVVNKVNNLSSKETNRSSSTGRKSSSSGQKGSQGKRKVKVDWTPELHRRFVQAVEQLGMDKAVPSRILELMGIDCLTRHNIASHLQKYRSHQKHLLAREAEAASWSQRRQIYGSTGAGGRGTSKRELINNMSNTTASSPTPWIAPTMGFPPPPPPPPHHPHPHPHPHHPPNLMHHHPFRPLHVWGHPTSVEHHQSSMHLWPKHLAHHSTPQRSRWTPPPPHPPPPDSSYWHHQRGVTPGTPCFNTQPLGTTRISSAAHPIPGIPPPVPHAMYKVDQGMGVVPSTQNGQQQSDSHSSSTTPFELHPTKERIDAAIGDVLSKPWLPLPLGLKPPMLDSVMVELQRQGIPKIPLTTCS